MDTIILVSQVVLSCVKWIHPKSLELCRAIDLKGSKWKTLTEIKARIPTTRILEL